MSDGVQIQRERADHVHGDTSEGLWDYPWTTQYDVNASQPP